MIKHLRHNEKLVIILMHGVNHDNLPPKDRSISQKNYFILISKLDKMYADGKLICYSNLP